MTPPNTHSRRTVRSARTVINVLCGVAATILVTHIILVMSGMDSAGGIASYVHHWAAEVSLGFNNLLTPADATMRVALNDGLAALVWLSFAVMVTILVRLLARPRLVRIN
jgi:hypothetical protein